MGNDLNWRVVVNGEHIIHNNSKESRQRRRICPDKNYAEVLRILGTLGNGNPP